MKQQSSHQVTKHRPGSLHSGRISMHHGERKDMVAVQRPAHAARGKNDASSNAHEASSRSCRAYQQCHTVQDGWQRLVLHELRSRFSFRSSMYAGQFF